MLVGTLNGDTEAVRQKGFEAVTNFDLSEYADVLAEHHAVSRQQKAGAAAGAADVAGAAGAMAAAGSSGADGAAGNIPPPSEASPAEKGVPPGGLSDGGAGGFIESGGVGRSAPSPSPPPPSPPASIQQRLMAASKSAHGAMKPGRGPSTFS